MTPSDLSYREIPLTKGQVAIVDVADFDWLNQWKWHAKWNPTSKSYYAARTFWTGTKHITILMHRDILGLKPGDKRHGDHVNHDTLNNRRINLRIATREQNRRNSRLSPKNKAGFKGIYLYRDGKYRAQITYNKKVIHLGYFVTKEEAHHAYINAAKKLHGEFFYAG